MYIKLAIQNMKKSIRNYVIYFVTITLTAAMMYSFLALGFSKEVLSMSENMSMLTSGILGMSVLVALIASFVISYAIRFMLEQRKKEFATYELLGMETSNIQKLFFIENGVIGMAAFFIGTFSGIGLSGVLVQIINHIFEMPHTYRISFSIKAFATAFILFMLMYGIGILRAAKVIRKRKIVDMLYDHHKNENGKTHSVRFHITLIILSVLCMRIAVPAVGILILFLVSYVNRYMLKRKQKEFSEDIEADFCNTGKAGLQKLKEKQYQLVILDVMMPGMDGFETLEEIRKENSLPILMFTSKNDSVSKVRGLRAGADDYLTKPFDMDELIARIVSLIRRYTRFNQQEGTEQQQLIFDGLKIDLENRSITTENGTFELPPKEFDLLLYCVKNQGKILTKQQIYEKVWGEEYFYDDSNIMAIISRLRKKLEVNPSSPKYIQTVKGIGYRFNKEV